MLLLGIDEGTTGVKAALFDERLQPLREARRDKVNRHPQPGWVEQDAEEVLAAVVEAVGELLAEAPGEVVACGLDHQGESVLAWDAESGRPLSPIVVWQDKRSQEVLDGMGAHEEEIRRLSGLPFDPYFSAAKLAWLLRERRGRGGRPRRGHAAHGHGRLLPVRPPRRRLCHRCLHRLAHAAARARARPASTRAWPSCSTCRSTCCPRCATRAASWACCATSRGRWSCRCAARWWTSRRRWRARAAWCPAA